jgi:hypothetical protein
MTVWRYRGQKGIDDPRRSQLQNFLREPVAGFLASVLRLGTWCYGASAQRLSAIWPQVVISEYGSLVRKSAPPFDPDLHRHLFHSERYLDNDLGNWTHYGIAGLAVRDSSSSCLRRYLRKHHGF